MKRSLILFLALLVCSGSFAQDLGELTGAFKTRYMRTANRKDLADFSATVAYGYLKYTYEVKNWLSFGGQVNGLAHAGIDNITKRDPLTGSGPIYEANLWNPNYLNGNTEFALPQLYAQLTFNRHKITLGRFLMESPIVNSEPWPFPNAMQGIWYDYSANKDLRIQLGGIQNISPRFTAQFDGIGETIGLIAAGVDKDGNPSGYPGNVNSNFLLVGNANYSFSESVTIDLWNYYTDNVSNTIYLEPSLKLENDLSIKTMLIYQFKVGEGGNENPLLAYLEDGHQAMQFGFRVEKKHNNSTFQLNFSRITNKGRMLLPRELGKEPFYTFQRRTRVEGMQNVTSIMVKWQRNWENESRKMRLFTSMGSNKLAKPDNAQENKLRLPSHLHWDASLKYEPKKASFNGFSAEMLLAYRFLNEEIGNDERARINRADFAHVDLILAYTF
ncbi:hypothetical protein [Roseivirga sp. E12]|uniref:hypothetical protein n=1 Tax=Roseivirga sp. E12 TaxID=2819237 RepID=UPI001ABC2345|nr:hypothetical protein [Roseivirga sp. E12]MBO3697912.1 hypothetical protein [Roseivirga sp. E12]